MTEINSDILEEAVEISNYISSGMDSQQYSGMLDQEFLLKEAWNRIEYIGFEAAEIPDPEEISISDFEEYASLPYEFGSLRDKDIIDLLQTDENHSTYFEADEIFPYIVIMDEAVRIVEDYSQVQEETEEDDLSAEVREMMAQFKQINEKG